MAEALPSCPFCRCAEEELSNAMNFNHPRQNNSTTTTRLLCAIVFCLFSFLWLYFFQSDTIAYGQHVFSKGRTVYSPLTGALLITVSLQVLQLVVYGFIRLERRWHALTYLPSFLLLAIISDIDEKTTGHLSLGHWCWVLPLLLVLWGVAVWLSYGFQLAEGSRQNRCQTAWVSLLTMGLLIVLTAAFANTNAVFHYRAHIEHCLQTGRVDEALATGRRSLETDESLTMLRASALARKGLMGERLFEYAVKGKSVDLLPLEGRSRCLMLPADSIYKYLGARPLQGMSTSHYYRTLLASRQARPVLGDYVLCGLLLEKQIDQFVRQLPDYYPVNDSLPKHYREALVLYAHLRSEPLLVYRHTVTEEDYSDLRKLESKHPSYSDRKEQVREKFGQTYWYYYKYEGNK